MYTKATIEKILATGAGVELRWLPGRDSKEMLACVEVAKRAGAHITLTSFPHELATQCAQVGGGHVTIKESYQ